MPNFNVEINYDNVIQDGSHYVLAVGPASLGDSNGVRCYQIINKETGVVESETSILARAYEHLEMLTSELERVLESKNRLKVVDSAVN